MHKVKGRERGQVEPQLGVEKERAGKATGVIWIARIVANRLASRLLPSKCGSRVAPRLTRGLFISQSSHQCRDGANIK